MTITRTITVRRDVAAESKADAGVERARLGRRGTLVVNLLSSPGAGKTSLLEATAKCLGDERSMAVLVGDLETDRDAQRLSPLVPTAQLTTGGACHLELPLVRRGLQAIGDPRVDFLFIENVGNLVCPALRNLTSCHMFRSPLKPWSETLAASNRIWMSCRPVHLMARGSGIGAITSSVSGPNDWLNSNERPRKKNSIVKRGWNASDDDRVGPRGRNASSDREVCQATLVERICLQFDGWRRSLCRRRGR